MTERDEDVQFQQIAATDRAIDRLVYELFPFGDGIPKGDDIWVVP